jgi:hypothetical protein
MAGPPDGAVTASLASAAGSPVTAIAARAAASPG